MATIKTTAGKDLTPKQQSLALTSALTALTLLNKTIMPGSPEDYVSQYQLDIICDALGIEAVSDTSVEVAEEMKYPVMMEFPLAIEGARAGLFQYSQLNLDI